ncbi:MAG TPA: hypothetical protein VM840_07295, partial [Actinomycetota bacterium]|nr:hypothetical protein [Actinomycetota bacterium]
VHVQTCDDCRTELARSTDVRTALSGLRHATVAVPPTLEADIIAALDRTWGTRARDVVTSHPRLWKGIGVGAAAAAAATALGVVVVRRRVRPGLAA